MEATDESSDLRAISSRYIYQEAGKQGEDEVKELICEEKRRRVLLQRKKQRVSSYHTGGPCCPSSSDPSSSSSDPSSSSAPIPHHFLLSPLSSTLKVQLNSDETDISFPRMVIDLFLDSIDLSLSDAQFGALDDFMGWMKNFQVGSKFRDIRPLESVKNDPRGWWRFACQAVLEENRKKRRVWDWGYLKKRKILRKKYVALYKKKRRGLLSTEGARELGRFFFLFFLFSFFLLTSYFSFRLELDEPMLCLEDILIFRGIADEVLRNEAAEEREEQKKKDQEKTDKGWGGWVSSWWGGQQDRPETPEVDKEEETAKKVAERRKMEDQIASQIWADLRTAVDYQEEDDDTKSESSAFVFPKEYVKIQGNLEIQNVSISLTESHWGSKKGLPKLTSMLMGSLDSVKLSLLQREGSLSAKGSLNSLELNDYVSLPGLVVALVRASSPKVIDGIVEVENEEGKNGKKGEEENGEQDGEGERKEEDNISLFTIDFEDHPLANPEIDYSLKISSKPVDITLTRPILKKMGQFFTTDSMSEEEKELLAYLWKIENEKQRKAEMDKYHEKLSNVEKGRNGVGEGGGGGAIFEAFGEAAASQMEYARQSAESQFQAMKLLLSQQNKPKILLDVEVEAPNVLIPRDTQSLLARIRDSEVKGREEAFPISEHDCVVLELGSISIKSVEDFDLASPLFADSPIGLPTTPLLTSNSPASPSSQDLHDFYDHFSVSVTGMRASLKDSSLCHVIHTNGQVIPLEKAPVVFGESVVVEKIDFFVRVDMCKLPLAHLPAIRLNLHFPFLGVMVSNFKIKKLVEISKGWLEFGATAPPKKNSSRKRKRAWRGTGRPSGYASFSPSSLFSPALTPSPSKSPSQSPSIPFLDSTTTWVTSPSSLFDLPTAHHATSSSAVSAHLSSQYFAPLSIGDTTPYSPSRDSFSYLPTVRDSRDSSSLHDFSLRDSMRDSINRGLMRDSHLRGESNMNLRESLHFLSPKTTFDSSSPSAGPHLPKRQSSGGAGRGPRWGEEQNFAPEEQKIELCFVLDEMRVTLLTESPKKIETKTTSSSSTSPSSSSSTSTSPKPLIVVSLQKTNISFRQTTHQQSARLGFGSFFVQDSSLLANPSIPPEYCFLCSSNPAHQPSLFKEKRGEEGEGGEGEEEDGLGIIEYIGTPKSSPKYWTCVAEHVISLKTSEMHVNVNRPVLVDILSTSNEITESLALLSSPPPPPPHSSPSFTSSSPPSPKMEKVSKRKSQYIPINKEERVKKNLKQRNLDYVNSLNSVEERLTDSTKAADRKSQFQAVGGGEKEELRGKENGAPLIPHLKASAVLGSISLSLNLEEYDEKGKEKEKNQEELTSNSINTKTVKSMKRFLFSTLGGSSFKIRIGAEGETNMSGTIGTISLQDLRSDAWSRIIDIKESEKLVDFSLKIVSLPSLNLPRTNPSSTISSSSASFSSYASYASFSSFGGPGSPVVGSPLSPLRSPTDSHIQRSFKTGKIPAKKVWGGGGEGDGRMGVVGPVRLVEADVCMSSVEVVGKTELFPLINEYFVVFSSPSSSGGEGKSEGKKEDEEGDEDEEDDESSSSSTPAPAVLNLTKLTLKINNCFIITPLDPSSPSSPFARFDFGKISVKNSHYLHPKLALFALPMEKMVVRVGAMKLQTCFPCLQSTSSPSSPPPSEKFRRNRSIREHVLWDTDLDVTLTRPMIPLYGLLDTVSPEDRMSLFPPPLAVGVSILGVEITMSDEQISFLLDVSVNLMNQMKRTDPSEEKEGEVGKGQVHEERVEGEEGEGEGGERVEDGGALVEYFVYLENFSILLSKATVSLSSSSSSSSSSSPSTLDPKNRTYEESEMVEMELQEVLRLSMSKMRQKFTMFFFPSLFFCSFLFFFFFSHPFLLGLMMGQ